MGEGEGEKDVSEEISNEEQLLGLQGQQEQEQEPTEQEDQGKQHTHFFCIGGNL